jgi:hypothetical protein
MNHLRDSPRAALRAATIVYLVLPNFIFLFGWLRLPYALAASGLLAVASWKALRGAPRDIPGDEARTQPISPRLLGAIAVVLVLWLSLSGIGEFGPQNPDWRFRNTVFRTLIEGDWPAVVSDGEDPRLLVSYIAYYLPAALVGKLAAVISSLEWPIANLALLLWSWVGAALAVLWLMRLGRSHSLLPVAILVFFAGLDVIGWIIVTGGLPGLLDNVGWWSYAKMHLLYPSFTGQLYWVPHQAIPAWLVVSLLVDEGLHGRSSRNLVFYGAIAILWSPFSTLGLVPYAAWVASLTRMKQLVSWPNLACLPLVATALLFLTSIEAGDIVRGWHWSFTPLAPLEYAIFVLLFLLLKFALLAAVVRHALKDDPDWETMGSLYWIMIACLCLIPLYQIGMFNDFCMRVSLPSLFVLLVLVTSALRPERLRRRELRGRTGLLGALLLVGALAPIGLMGRSLVQVSRDPGVLLPSSSAERVESFDELARKFPLFAQQYSAVLHSSFARHLGALPPDSRPRSANAE